MLTAMVVFLFVPAMIFEWKAGLKSAGAKVKILHFSIMLISFCVLLLYSFDISLPSPSNMIGDLVEAIQKRMS